MRMSEAVLMRGAEEGGEEGGDAGGGKGGKYERRKSLYVCSGCPLAAKRGGGGVSLLKLRN